MWVVVLATVGLIFDGYDLVVYGTVVSTFLRDPSHIGNVTPAIAGVLGSYALVGSTWARTRDLRINRRALNWAGSPHECWLSNVLASNIFRPFRLRTVQEGSI